MTALPQHRSAISNPRPTLARGDASRVLEEIWRSQSHNILSTTYRITRNLADAEDALQDTFLKAHAHIRDFDSRSSLSTWLTRIAINSALTILRKNHRATVISIDDTLEDRRFALSTILADVSPDPETQWRQRERERLLRTHIAGLPSALRDVVQFHSLEERSVEETASILGHTISAAKSRLFRARARLRSSLQPSVATLVRASRLSPLEP